MSQPSLTSKPQKNVSERSRASRKSPSKSGSASAKRDSAAKLRVKKAVNRKNDALRRLGVTSGELSRVAQITPVLQRAEGGIPAVLDALRFSLDPAAQFFIQRYDKVPKGDRDKLPWEAICIAAKVNPSTLLGAAIMALQEVSKSTVKILALTNHPRVMEARIAAAVLPGGHQDRNAFDTGVGFLPSPKGPTFVTNVKVDNKRRGDDENDEDGDDRVGSDTGDYEAEDEMDHLFPAVAAMQERLQPIRQRALGDGK